jgi:DNA polymerase-3 subunit delta
MYPIMAKKSNQGPTNHLFQLLANPSTLPRTGLCVIVGTDYFLQQLALKTVQAQFANEQDDHQQDDIRWFDEKSLWVDVMDEVSTVTLFGGDGPRIAGVNDADKFIKDYRPKLEKYIERESHAGLLILEAKSFPGNTNLAKKVNALGGVIDCRTPAGPPVRQNERPLYDLTINWVVNWAKQQYQFTLSNDVAALLLDLSQFSIALLNMNCVKLALYLEPGDKPTAEQIQKHIGGWKSQSTFHMTDVAAEGKAATALLELQHLRADGEAVQKIFGGVSWSLRRYVTITRIAEQLERTGTPIRQALQQATREVLGNSFHFQGQKTIDHLCQLRRQRSGQLLRWLLEADLDMKNQFSKSGLPLEKLMLYLDESYCTGFQTPSTKSAN